MSRATAPIGVFDSGLGGLHLSARLRRRLPAEALLYLGDSARVPYGTRSPMIIERYTHEALTALLHEEVKVVVLACHTASAHALDGCRQRSPVPVLGMIEAGRRAIEAALPVTAAETPTRVLVLGTSATIRSGAYQRALTPLAGRISLCSLAAPLLVPLVESGWARHRLAVEIAREYLTPLAADPPALCLLACTHYPLLRETLEEAAASIFPTPPRFIDPADALIDQLIETLQSAAELTPIEQGEGSCRLWCTAPPLEGVPFAEELWRAATGAQLPTFSLTELSSHSAGELL